MGGFLVLFVSILIMILVTLTPSANDPAVSPSVVARPALQSVAANMIDFHRAAIYFARKPENRNPNGGMWTFSYSSQDNVRCSTTYAGGTYLTNGIATSPNCSSGLETEFRLPSYYAALYDWNVYYESDGPGGADDILITYVKDSIDSVAGYSSEQVLAALNDYDLQTESNWYWGVTEASGSPLSLDDGEMALSLPSAFSVHGVSAIATIIP